MSMIIFGLLVVSRWSLVVGIYVIARPTAAAIPQRGASVIVGEGFIPPERTTKKRSCAETETLIIKLTLSKNETRDHCRRTLVSGEREGQDPPLQKSSSYLFRRSILLIERYQLSRSVIHDQKTDHIQIDKQK